MAAVAPYALLGALLAVVAAWEGGRSRDSAWAHVSVAAAILVALVASVGAGWGRQRQSPTVWVRATVSGWRGASHDYRAGVVLWILLLAGVAAWDVRSFVAQAHDLPTLSRIVGTVSAHPAGRGLLFALWLAAGAYLAVGWRSARRRSRRG